LKDHQLFGPNLMECKIQCFCFSTNTFDPDLNIQKNIPQEKKEFSSLDLSPKQRILLAHS